MIRYSVKQYGNSFSIRQLLGLDRGNLTLQVKEFPFSIMFHNMALMVSPAPYKGTDRNGVISELVKRIKSNPPDVVGLCEVFSDGERDKIRTELLYIYPYYQEGPDESDGESDGGLLVLSKYQIMASHHSIYRQCAGWDRFANKGVIHIRIHPMNSPTHCDIFFSHTQNIEEEGGKDALYAQLTHLGHMFRAYIDPHVPALIIGDLNIPGYAQEHYAEMLKRLGMPIDLWKVTYPNASGLTFTTDNNFYDDSGDIPQKSQRLDYVLLRSGDCFIPIPEKIDILKWTLKGRQISDHYGIYAEFNQLMQIIVDISGTISKVTAAIIGFRCIEETDERGSDEVSFSLSIRDQYNNLVESVAPITENVSTGEYHKIVGMTPVILSGDPGNSITIETKGTEHDNFLNPNDSLGLKYITISRNDLLLNKGRSFERVMPYLTGDGGEYGVEIKVSVE